LGSVWVKMSTSDVQLLMADLFHFCEAFSGDPMLARTSVASDAEKLKTTPPAGPVMRCGEVANTRKHSIRDDPNKRAAVVVRELSHADGPVPTANRKVRTRWTVEYVDADGNRTAEDAWDLAREAFGTWDSFLRKNSLI
jgi:hypothetical protein